MSNSKDVRTSRENLTPSQQALMFLCQWLQDQAPKAFNDYYELVEKKLTRHLRWVVHTDDEQANDICAEVIGTHFELLQRTKTRQFILDALGRLAKTDNDIRFPHRAEKKAWQEEIKVGLEFAITESTSWADLTCATMEKRVQVHNEKLLELRYKSAELLEKCLAHFGVPLPTSRSKSSPALSENLAASNKKQILAIDPFEARINAMDRRFQEIAKTERNGCGATARLIRAELERDYYNECRRINGICFFCRRSYVLATATSNTTPCLFVSGGRAQSGSNV
jgi:hypothetical protein